jgi:serine phosphatase RsbU (regulator of sigma subunit)
MNPYLENDFKGNILVVDDVPANLRLLSKILGEHGYRTRPIPDGTMAIESARIEIPDLILLDIRMPGMNGYQVCKSLKSDELTKDIPIIFISALDATHDKVKAFAFGGVDYITKPFQAEEVIARVDAHIALRNLQKQLQETNLQMEKELTLAGEVQRSYLPREIPSLPGWQIAVELKPARETSGDFFDVHTLPNGQLGIMIADVVDKGVSAALFMALCYSLIRTYAAEFLEEPEKLFDAVNRRVLEDTNARQFVTVFYAVLDPTTGEMIYCNAGQCPSLFFSSQNGKSVLSLLRTGPPLGVFEQQTWERKSIQFGPGDVLVLYTDGISEALDDQETFYSEARLVTRIEDHVGDSAGNILNSVLADLGSFLGGGAPQDDLTIIVVKREE